MNKVLSIDLAYKQYEDFGMCLLECNGDSVDVRFPSPAEMGFLGPPTPSLVAKNVVEYCSRQGIRLVLLDGPQGWKDPDNGIAHCRICEKELNTSAKTGLIGNVKPDNYKRFVQFSIATFAELTALGTALVEDSKICVPENCLLAVESYPHSAWRQLKILPLPAKKKAREDDLRARLRILSAVFHICVDRSPNHDEIQALVSGMAGLAILSARTDGYVASGVPPIKHGEHILEGFIVNPRI